MGDLTLGLPSGSLAFFPGTEPRYECHNENCCSPTIGVAMSLLFVLDFLVRIT